MNRPTRQSSLPFVRINVAMSADGKIATADRKFSSFGSSLDKRLMQTLRAEADAILVGARTAYSNRAGLGPNPEEYRRQRVKQGLAPAHLRVIVTGRGNIDPATAMLRDGFGPILIIASRSVSKRRVAKLRSIADEVFLCGAKRIDLPRALRWLRAKWRVKYLLCEGGGELNGSLFVAGLVDEICLTICPLILGGQTAPTIADGNGALRLADAQRFRLVSKRRIGEELFLRFRAIRKPAVEPQRTQSHRAGRPVPD